MEEKYVPFKQQMLRSLTESYNTGLEEYFRLLSSITPFSKKEEIKEVEAKTKEIKESPNTFGRVAAQTAKQVILQRLREAEQEIVMIEYQDKIHTVTNGVVARVEGRLVRVDLGKAQAIMPASEQIYSKDGHRKQT